MAASAKGRSTRPDSGLTAMKSASGQVGAKNAAASAITARTAAAEAAGSGAALVMGPMVMGCDSSLL
ncbi:hypothetical protein NE857_01910 [Nocardiopsis exhalans]|uniref:Uncharacterized protein n=1 Tax=Nocardiopsis exhalans TaxID=163604 RepID=A0ABY5DI67_9ACTN|nr:hypothetical protein [Nocardiopsis exhalans]USY23526.1 hypothetical protein NE857_01910 [Nocardiopsis exhalans]